MNFVDYASELAQNVKKLYPSDLIRLHYRSVLCQCSGSNGVARGRQNFHVSKNTKFAIERLGGRRLPLYSVPTTTSITMYYVASEQYGT